MVTQLPFLTVIALKVKTKLFIINVGVTILNKDVRGGSCSPLPVRGLIPLERNENMALRVMIGFPISLNVTKNCADKQLHTAQQ